MAYAGNPSDNVDRFLIYAPDSLGTGTVNLQNGTDLGIDISQYEYFEVLVLIGDMVATGTLDVKFYDADDIDVTTNRAEVTALALGQYAAGTDDNTLFAREIKCDVRRKYLDVELVVGTAASEVAVYGVGYKPQYSRVVGTYPVASADGVAEIGLA